MNANALKHAELVPRHNCRLNRAIVSSALNEMTRGLAGGGNW